MYEEKKSKTIADLNALYSEAETVDRDLFSEMRSNVLLCAGDHYSKKLSAHMNRLRDNKSIPDSTLIKITKNHTYKISKYYEASIYSHSPGVAVQPRNATEIQDQKTAELNQAVWAYQKDRNRLKERFRSSVGSFFKIGEVCWVVKWDPTKGTLKGYEGKVGEFGEPELDEMGQPVPDMTKPVMSGGLVYEEVLGPNLLRGPTTKDMIDNSCWIVRKMVGIKDLKAKYKGDEEKLGYIQEGTDDTFIIFDANKSSYSESKKECLVREFYYPPCQEYPKGYFFITTEHGILEEGELPFGIWSIAWAGWDIYPTSPRGRSPVKQMRPYQVEINRSASQLCQNQLTLGQDKLVYQSGTKLSAGSLLPGVRGITYQGMPPTVIPGRDGSQFLGYMESTIAELYSVMMVDELLTEKAQQSQDLLVELFKSMRQKTKFSEPAEKFERFMMDVCDITLQLCKNYLEDDELIPAIGRAEYINVAEFRNSDPIHYRIKLEPQDDSLDTKMGKQLTLNHILQYVGSNLERDDIGKLIKAMPFANDEEVSGDFTLKYENARNLMLQIERGEEPMLHVNDDADYMLMKLSNRMKKPDYSFLAEEVRSMYDQVYQHFVDLRAQQQQEILAAKNEYIPANGPLVGADLYVDNKEDPTKEPKRARVPSQALQWLLNQLERQGLDQAALDQQDAHTQAEIASQSVPSQGNVLPFPGQGMGG